MARGATSTKTFRHGSVSVVLTALVVVAVILLNTIVTNLAVRYGWFVNMRPTLLYPVTDACYDYMDEYVVPLARESGEPIRIIFCDEEDNIRADSTQMFVLNTAEDLVAAYPDLVKIEYLNIWERPSEARRWGVNASTSVVVAHGNNHRVCTLRDFFSFPASDNSTPTAYNGEKRLAVAMRAVVTPDTPKAYFTLNHGESFPDYALMYAIVNAGYTVDYLDALSFDIPEDCALLVTYNPARDFTTAADGVSGISEIDRLSTYMQKGGKYMVFVSADTFAAGSFGNLEGYLAGWGVSFDHRTGAGGIEECFAIRDTGHALSTDGYTILAKLADNTAASALSGDVVGGLRVGNATGISVAEDFTAGEGVYRNGSRTLTPLLTSHAGSEAWAGGRAVGRTEAGYPLFTMTYDSESDAHLMVCSSIELATEDSLQSGVFANESFLMAALSLAGKDDTPLALRSQPFADDTIHTMTTAEARTVTIALVATPTVTLLAAGLIVLLRRKYA